MGQRSRGYRLAALETRSALVESPSRRARSFHGRAPQRTARASRDGNAAMTSHVLVVDQGTTSTRAIIFGPDAAPVAIAQQEFRQIYPHPGWIEHDPADLWATTMSTMREAVGKSSLPASAFAAIGLTNQRETTLVWSRKTGAPVYNAIVWQDRRTADHCARLQAEGSSSWSASVPACCSIPIFRRRKSPGFSTTSKARVLEPRAANSPSAQSTRTCCGA